MDVHVNEVEYNYARVQELLSQALSEKPDIIVLARNMEYRISSI